MQRTTGEAVGKSGRKSEQDEQRRWCNQLEKSGVPPAHADKSVGVGARVRHPPAQRQTRPASSCADALGRVQLAATIHMPKLVRPLFVLLHCLSLAYAGCYQRRLCCHGRNVTCAAIEDGIAHLPTAAPPESHSSRIGQLKLADWFEIEGSGERPPFITRAPSKRDTVAALSDEQPNSTPAGSVQHLLLGLPYWPGGVFSEHVRYQGEHPILRYSLLNQHMPLTVDEETPSHFAYLAAGETACYCDAECVRLGDCCSDYTFVCPPSDCFVSAWSPWSQCEPTNGAECGAGVQSRSRTIQREDRFGGQSCPQLNESAVCFRSCEQSEAAPSTALLVPYRLAGTRAGVQRNNIYWDLPEVVQKVEKLIHYCVIYEIGWVNRNCVEKEAKASLAIGRQICAECQPEAQMHRDDQRCSSDLSDGQLGFWKLIGPQSCTGVWTRQKRKDNCSCATDFPELSKFLLV